MEWREIPGFPGYLASDAGLIRSLPRKGSRNRVLEPHTRYMRGKPVCQLITVCVNGKPRTMRVHRLVLMAFVGPCPPKHEGCHNNGDPTDNRLSNLRWDTHAANLADAAKHGTKTAPPIFVGENHANSKLTLAKVNEIRAEPAYHGILVDLGRKYGVSHQTIRRVRHGVCWR